MFFALRPKLALLSDLNFDLMTTYRAVRDEPQLVKSILQEWPNSEEKYYEVRDLTPRHRHEVAARLIFLTSLSFNGIFRQNLKGEFNVPYGYKSHVDVAAAVKFDEASKTLGAAQLLWSDFEPIIDRSEARDFVYVDPPYTVAHNNNGFVKYNERIFSWADQIRLAKACERARQRGAYVIVSNANHVSLDELYSGFRKLEVTRSCVIAADAEHRTAYAEALYFSYG